MKTPENKPEKTFHSLESRIEAMRQKVAASKALQTSKKPRKANDSAQIQLFENAEEIIQAELNTGKLANFIFLSPRSKEIDQVRVFSYERDGRTISLTISPAIYIGHNTKTPQAPRTLTTTSSELWYTILQIWERRGCPSDGVIYTSGIEIFRILNIKAGKAAYQQLYRELTVLRSSVLTWDFSFIEIKNEEKAAYEGRRETSFLADFSYLNKRYRKTNDIFSQLLTITINPFMVKNIEHGLSKPLRFREYLKISSYDAKRLYAMLDIFLVKKTTWERNSIALFDELGIRGKRYQNQFARKAKIKELIEHLNHKKISNGTLKLSIREGKKDLVLVAKKTGDTRKKVRKKLRPSINDSETINLLVSDIHATVPGFSVGAGIDGGANIVTRYAMTYPPEVIMRALSRYKADAKHDPSITSHPAIFTAFLHCEVHLHGLNWIGKGCTGDTCKYRSGRIELPSTNT